MNQFRLFSAQAVEHYLKSSTMQATVFEGAGLLPRWKEMPVPKIQEPTDIVVRVHKTTICGTDLNILGGNVPRTKPGTILGHEGIGHVVAKGSEVKEWELGDRVLTSCITACGKCKHCLQGLHAFCIDGGWELGHTIDGMQAEFARIRHADYTCVGLPKSVPEGSKAEDAYVMVSDILPTGYEIGLRSGQYDSNGSVAIVGVGPVGLAALLALKADRVFAVDLDDNRLKVAKSMGATDLINNEGGTAVEQIMSETDGRGVDYVVECIGTPLGWGICQDLVAMGGQISILGVHGKPGVFDLAKLWEHNISIHTGMVHCHSMRPFMAKIESGELEAQRLISHEYDMNDMELAYNNFTNAQDTGSLKVLITNNRLS